MLSQDICCDFGTSDEPDFTIKGGSTYSTLDLLVGSEGSTSADHFIDDSDFYSCGVNALGALPVELLHFNAKEDTRHQILLSWVTGSEINNKHFEIERSSNGRNFEVIGMIEGNGTTTFTQNYSFLDSRPIPLAYYRLKQLDYEGKFDYSEILTVRMKSFENVQMDAYPTIAKDEITIRFTTFDTQKSRMRIVSSFGKLMHEEDIYSTGLLEYRKFDLSKIQPGIYNVILTDGDNYVSLSFVVIKTY